LSLSLKKNLNLDPQLLLSLLPLLTTLVLRLLSNTRVQTSGTQLLQEETGYASVPAVVTVTTRKDDNSSHLEATKTLETTKNSWFLLGLLAFSLSSPLLLGKPRRKEREKTKPQKQKVFIAGSLGCAGPIVLIPPGGPTIKNLYGGAPTEQQEKEARASRVLSASEVEELLKDLGSLLQLQKQLSPQESGNGFA